MDFHDAFRIENYFEKNFFKFLGEEIDIIGTQNPEDLENMGYTDDDIIKMYEFYIAGKKLLKEENYKVNISVFKNEEDKNEL